MSHTTSARNIHLDLIDAKTFATLHPTTRKSLICRLTGTLLTNDYKRMTGKDLTLDDCNRILAIVNVAIESSKSDDVQVWCGQIITKLRELCAKFRAEARTDDTLGKGGVADNGGNEFGASYYAKAAKAKVAAEVLVEDGAALATQVEEVENSEIEEIRQEQAAAAITKEPTREEFAGALAIATAIAGAIKSLGSVPSGHLYANLMSKLSLEQYESCINLLAKVGMIKVENHLITWIGK